MYFTIWRTTQTNGNNLKNEGVYIISTQDLLMISYKFQVYIYILENDNKLGL